LASRSAPEHPEDKWACGIACFECDHAERNEYGTGRIYTITYQATDESGNTATKSATVTVPVEPYDERRAALPDGSTDQSEGPPRAGLLLL
jgi:hypothetical protein